jgi:hypothetical protein
MWTAAANRLIASRNALASIVELISKNTVLVPVGRSPWPPELEHRVSRRLWHARALPCMSRAGRKGRPAANAPPRRISISPAKPARLLR